MFWLSTHTPCPSGNSNNDSETSSIVGRSRLQKKHFVKPTPIRKPRGLAASPKHRDMLWACSTVQLIRRSPSFTPSTNPTASRLPRRIMRSIVPSNGGDFWPTANLQNVMNCCQWIPQYRITVLRLFVRVTGTSDSSFSNRQVEKEFRLHQFFLGITPAELSAAQRLR